MVKKATSDPQKTPLRVGVFTSATSAANAVRALLRTGFPRHEITVIGPQGTETWLAEFATQEPAGNNTPLAAATGGTLGATLGGGLALAAGLLTGLPGIIVSIGLATWTGGVFGGLVGAMMTRGVEKEAADFYDQALRDGRTLVAVEPEGEGAPQRMQQAEQVLADAGAEPLRLPAG